MSVSVRAVRTVVNELRHGSCPCCGSANLAPIGPFSYGSETVFSTVRITTTHVPELWECRQCRSRFTQNAVTERVAEALYQEGHSAERWRAAPFCEQQREEVVRVVEPKLRPGAVVVDVGSNTGEFLDFAQHHGCQTQGVEFSAASRAVAEAKGHTMHTRLDALPPGTVDLITAFDLVEHLYHLDAFMSACHAVLKPGGKLVILTGNPQCLAARLYGARWWYASFPEHVVFPSRFYFAEHTPFGLEQVFPTYASKASRLPAWEVLRNALYGLWHHTGTALQLGPDHLLLVLRKALKPQAPTPDMGSGTREESR